MTESENALAQLTAATRMLSEARTLDDVRAIRDMAEAARAYAVAAKLGSEAIGHASAIKIDAERKAGVILAEMKTTGQRAAGRPGKVSQPATLSDLDITRDQSSKWQALARLPDDEYAEVRKSVETRARKAEDRAVGEVMAAEEDRLFATIAPEAVRANRIAEAVGLMDRAAAIVIETRPHSPEEVQQLTTKARYVVAIIAPTRGNKMEVIK